MADQEIIKEKANRVVERLLQMQKDKGVMAALRCLLNPNLKHRGWQAIERIEEIGDFAVETTAGLFAVHRIHSADKKSVGSSCRDLRNREKRDEGGKNPLDVRFRRILAADRAELPALLQRMFHRFERNNIEVNYLRLFQDLTYWGDHVRERWAKEYWANQQQEKEQTNVSE